MSVKSQSIEEGSFNHNDDMDPTPSVHSAEMNMMEAKNVESEVSPPPALTLNSTQEPKVKIINEIPNVLDQFEKDLKERGAKCEIVDKNGSMRIVCIARLPFDNFATAKDWEDSILKYLSDVFKYY